MEDEKVNKIFFALSNPKRLKILELLGAEIVLCGCVIAERLNFNRSTIARHLSILKKAGLLKSWKQGARVNYRISDLGVFKVIDVAKKIKTN